MVFAIVNMMPMDPPIAGPRVLQRNAYFISFWILDTISPGYDIVHSSPGYLAIAGDGGQREGGEPGDHIAQGYHHQTLGGK